jgi:EcsC protein family
MSNEDLEDLRRATHLLGTTSLAARVANAVGRPLEQVVAMLPRGATDVVTAAVNRALAGALDVAIRSLRSRSLWRTEALHKLAVATTGATGGAFGLAAITVELPVSTALMLRSIAEIAKEEGESLDQAEPRLACLQVFALGGPTAQDDALETGYFAVRAAMAKGLAEAAEFVAKEGIAARGAPALVRFVAQIAARFGVPVSQKIVAQSLPVVGALGGASINVAFLHHFQDVARGHFIMRRLERKYGAAAVREMCSRL